MTAIEQRAYRIGMQASNEVAEPRTDGSRFSTNGTSNGTGAWEEGVGRLVGGANTWKSPQIPVDQPVFTASVAADLLGLHPRTLRIYEEKQLVVPARTAGNRRRYSPNDIDRFQSIRKLTAGGVNLEGVRIILEMADELAKLGGDPDGVIERNLGAADDGRRGTDD